MPHCTLTAQPFAAAAALTAFTAQAADAGAIASFTGRMRAVATDGSAIDALVLESYRGVTLASMQAICDAALARFAISDAVIIHRYGRIAPGDDIVFVAAAASHRRAAFDAVDYMMDGLKTEAVFWKYEEWGTARHWIEPTAADRADHARWGTTA